MVDRYTRAVLTVIAVALVWLCMKEPMPTAEAKTTPAQTRGSMYVEPGIKGVVILGVADAVGADRFRKTGALSFAASPTGSLPVAGVVGVSGPVNVTGTVGVDQPVLVTGTVDVDQPVLVTGTVDVDQPVQVTGTVDIDQPVRVKGTVDVGNWSDAALWLGR